MKKKISIIILALILTVFAYMLTNKKASAPSSQQSENTSSNSKQEDSTGSMDTKDLSKYTIDVQESLYVIVNKNRPIGLNYIPSNLVRPTVALDSGDSAEEQQLRSEAATAAQSMFADAKKAGFDLVMASGYRSSNMQRTVYNGYVSRDGQAAADRYSARPGTSEHQTGLALDITTTNHKCYLEICFADTKEGKWLKNNAHKYGFHLRYQKGKENITGYQFEPWHFRYVGVDLAQRLFDDNKTMEEFFDL